MADASTTATVPFSMFSLVLPQQAPIRAVTVVNQSGATIGVYAGRDTTATILFTVLPYQSATYPIGSYTGVSFGVVTSGAMTPVPGTLYAHISDQPLSAATSPNAQYSPFSVPFVLTYDSRTAQFYNAWFSGTFGYGNTTDFTTLATGFRLYTPVANTTLFVQSVSVRGLPIYVGLVLANNRDAKALSTGVGAFAIGNGGVLGVGLIQAGLPANQQVTGMVLRGSGDWQFPSPANLGVLSTGTGGGQLNVALTNFDGTTLPAGLANPLNLTISGFIQ